MVDYHGTRLNRSSFIKEEEIKEEEEEMKREGGEGWSGRGRVYLGK